MTLAVTEWIDSFNDLVRLIVLLITKVERKILTCSIASSRPHHYLLTISYLSLLYEKFVLFLNFDETLVRKSRHRHTYVEWIVVTAAASLVLLDSAVGQFGNRFSSSSFAPRRSFASRRPSPFASSNREDKDENTQPSVSKQVSVENWTILLTYCMPKKSYPFYTVTYYRNILLVNKITYGVHSSNLLKELSHIQIVPNKGTPCSV